MKVINVPTRHGNSAKTSPVPPPLDKCAMQMRTKEKENNCAKDAARTPCQMQYQRIAQRTPPGYRAECNAMSEIRARPLSTGTTVALALQLTVHLEAVETGVIAAPVVQDTESKVFGEHVLVPELDALRLLLSVEAAEFHLRNTEPELVHTFWPGTTVVVDIGAGGVLVRLDPEFDMASRVGGIEGEVLKLMFESDSKGTDCERKRNSELQLSLTKVRTGSAPALPSLGPMFERNVCLVDDNAWEPLAGERSKNRVEQGHRSSSDGSESWIDFGANLHVEEIAALLHRWKWSDR